MRHRGTEILLGCFKRGCWRSLGGSWNADHLPRVHLITLCFCDEMDKGPIASAGHCREFISHFQLVLKMWSNSTVNPALPWGSFASSCSVPRVFVLFTFSYCILKMWRGTLMHSVVRGVHGLYSNWSLVQIIVTRDYERECGDQGGGITYIWYIVITVAH